VNYGAESFEAEYDEILHDEAEVMWWGTYTGTINVPTKQGKQYYANFDIVEDPDFSAESFDAEKRYRYGDRYITRDSKGRFKKNVDVGRSLAADRRQKAKTKVTGEGQGGVGDYEAEDIVESLQNRSQRVGFSMNGWVASILVIGASFFAGRRFEKR
jgi:hypothetical protein